MLRSDRSSPKFGPHKSVGPFSILLLLAVLVLSGCGRSHDKTVIPQSDGWIVGGNVTHWGGGEVIADVAVTTPDGSQVHADSAGHYELRLAGADRPTGLLGFAKEPYVATTASLDSAVVAGERRLSLNVLMYFEKDIH